MTGFKGPPTAHDPENASLAEWHSVHRTNLDGTFLGCRYAIRAMKAKGDGSIINISSRSGLVGIPGAADESAYVTGSEFHIDGGLLAGSAASPGD